MTSSAPPTLSVPPPSRVLLHRPAFWAAAGAVLAFAVCHFSFPDPIPHNKYVPLADAILHGRVDLVDPPQYPEITTYRGRHYMP